MSTATITTTAPASYHHLEQGAIGADIPVGTPLRDALRLLRAVRWGDIGGMHAVALSDGTTLSVTLTPASDTGYLMGSQVAERTRWDDYAGRDVVVRRYSIRRNS